MKACPLCNRILKERIKERRLCTQHADDKKNYLLSCFQEKNDGYKVMWVEYMQSSIG